MTELLSNLRLFKEGVISTEERIRIRQVYPGDNERLAVLLQCTPLPNSVSLAHGPPRMVSQ